MKIFKKILKFVAVVIVGILVLGSITEVAMSISDNKKLVAPGTIVEVEGSKMHLYSVGEGEKTIVLIPGLGTHAPYVDFQPLWSLLSQNNKVIVVERFGYGFSDITKTDRTMENIISEMDQALGLIGEEGPYSLVGHSLGGIISIAYAQAYPEKVENIIMLDARVPEAYNDLPKGTHVVAFIGRILKYTGIDRLAKMEAIYELTEVNGYKEVPKGLWDTDKRLYMRNPLNRNVRNELKHVGDYGRYSAKDNSNYQVPTLFISTPGLMDKDKEAEYIAKLKKGELIVLDGGHYIHQYLPREVSQAIDYFIKE
jgi:pimeloyl-ACP methyl ester carboxylesterase